MQEVYNKLNRMAKMGMEVFKNSNWRTDPIFQPRTTEEQKIWDSLPVWLGNAATYAINTAGPIAFQNISKNRDPGSNLNPFEQAIGIRQANTALRDPFAHTRQQDGCQYHSCPNGARTAWWGGTTDRNKHDANGELLTIDGVTRYTESIYGGKTGRLLKSEEHLCRRVPW